MRHVAVIGSGPAGYYSAEALQKLLEGFDLAIRGRAPQDSGLIARKLEDA